MTIRDHLQRRWLQVFLTCTCVGLLPALVLQRFAPEYPLLGAAALGFIFVGVYAFMAIMRRTPCPRCAAALEDLAVRIMSKRFPVKNCPHCGVKFDEQMSNPSRTRF